MDPLDLKIICLLKCKKEPYRTELYQYVQSCITSIKPETYKFIFEYLHMRRYNTESISLMIVNDTNIKLSILLKYIKIKSIPDQYITHELLLIFLNNFPKDFSHISVKFLTEDFKKKVIRFNPFYIRYISNPSDELYELAVKQNSFALSCKYIQIDNIEETPQYNLYKLAVTNFGITIVFVPLEYLNQELCEIAMSNCKLSICCIPPTERKKFNLHLTTNHFMISHREVNIVITNIYNRILSEDKNIKDIRKYFYRELYNEHIQWYHINMVHNWLNISTDEEFMKEMSYYYPPIYDEYY